MNLRTQRPKVGAALCVSRLLVTDKPCETDLIEFSFSAFSMNITRLELLLLAVGFMLLLIAVNAAAQRFLFRSGKRHAAVFLALLALQYAVPFMLLDAVMINGAGLRIASPALAFMAYLVFSACFLLQNVVFLFGLKEADGFAVPLPGGRLRVSWKQLLTGMTVAWWTLAALASGKEGDD